jgi:hypothetical protein
VLKQLAANQKNIEKKFLVHAPIESVCEMKNKNNWICLDVPHTPQPICSQQTLRYGCVSMPPIATCKRRQERSLNISLFVP